MNQSCGFVRVAWSIRTQIGSCGKRSWFRIISVEWKDDRIEHKDTGNRNRWIPRQLWNVADYHPMEFVCNPYEEQRPCAPADSWKFPWRLLISRCYVNQKRADTRGNNARLCDTRFGSLLPRLIALFPMKSSRNKSIDCSTKERKFAVRQNSRVENITRRDTCIVSREPKTIANYRLGCVVDGQIFYR